MRRNPAQTDKRRDEYCVKAEPGLGIRRVETPRAAGSGPPVVNELITLMTAPQSHAAS